MCIKGIFMKIKNFKLETFFQEKHINLLILIKIDNYNAIFVLEIQFPDMFVLLN